MRCEFLWATIALLTTASMARADDKAACTRAFDESQDLRRDKKLIEAREQLGICAGPVCAGFMNGKMGNLCVQWRREVEAAMPSVVLSATRGGQDVPNAKMTIDGTLVAIAGVAINLDPGEHRAVFEGPDGSKVSFVFTAEEGMPAKRVARELPPLPAAAPESAKEPPVVAPPAPSAPTPVTPSEPAPTPHQEGGATPWKPIGLAAAAVGVVGLGLGVGFGIAAISDKNSAACGADNYCNNGGPLSDAKSAATLSTVGFVAGGVLLAGGAAVVLFAPTGRESTVGSVRAAPMVAERGGGLVIGGSW